MFEVLEKIKGIENQIEQALWAFEAHNKIEKALEVYLDAESNLDALDIATENPAYVEQQRVLSYCLMRQGNILRQMKKPEEALALSERELVAARASDNEIMLARSLMSNGTNHIVIGEVAKGLALIKEACELFKSGDSYDHQQGLGWHWILQADLANAKIIQRDPSEVVEMANRALELLTPLENWPGVARAYAARAKAHESLANEEAAEKDRKEQQYYESKIELQEGAT
jgi:tetratricopeptide (TPR) repeat protein